MELIELKKQMSVLEQVLSKTSAKIEVDVKTSSTAQVKILKKYRQAILNCAILAIVFACLWIGNVSPDKLPNFYKAFIVILCSGAAMWYTFLYQKLKNVKVAALSPARLISATTNIRILTLTGEIVSGIALAVFFTMLLTDMIVMSKLAFYLIIATLCGGLSYSALYFWPKYIKLFRDLNSIKN